ncbi:amino acid adenylation domain-containing protein [Flavobacteriaceae bacterium R38]|nr:amino acid adenylation domain-containing protein [Flavobacteriaceae bacterium R38]
MESTPISLTQSQSLLWIGQKLAPSSPLYNMVMRYDIYGEIEVDFFKKAFEIVAQNSEALQFTFYEEKGQPYQKIKGEMPGEMMFVDHSQHQNPIETYNKWETERKKQLFDLSKCLYDSVLIKINAEHYIWYFNQHHLITDAWSKAVLFSKVSELYSKLLNKDQEVAVSIGPYRNFTAFEAKSQSESAYVKEKEFWKEKAQEHVTTLALYQNKTPKKQSTAATRHVVNLGKERSHQLKALANEKGIRLWTLDLSLYNVFLTALFAYLYRVSGQESFSVGTPSHNRMKRDFKDTIGYLVEIFPIAETVRKNDTFLSLLKRIQIGTNDFLKHVQPGLSNTRLNRNFNVLFNYINTVHENFNGIHTTSSWVHPGHQDPAHYFRLHVQDFHNTGEFSLYFDLNNEVFNEDLQKVIPEHFINVLDAFIKNKNQEILAQPVLSNQEYHQMITVFNDTDTQITDNSCLISQIEKQAEKTPDAISVRHKERFLTYKELNDKANRLARCLLSQSIGEGSHVAIYLKRSPEYVISVLAVLKTGATYIPVPTNYPQERISYILNDAQAKTVITHNEYSSSKIYENTNIIDIDTFDYDAYESSNLAVIPNIKSTAFLIYTSGSTGHPKGVQIVNESLTNYIHWTKDAYIDYTNQPNIPLFTTTGFDITANSVFLPLLCGGTIHVYQEKGDQIDIAITDVIEDNKVDFIKLTPAHGNFIKGKSLKDSLVKVVVVTGDTFKTELGNHIYEAFEGNPVSIFNEYGPSEATIGCTYHKFTPGSDSPDVPIGSPIYNMKAYVLDDFKNPVPHGVTGELYLSGKGLASGYLGKETLTREKFIENPFEKHTLIYRTQDLVRWNEEGVLEYLGRTDFQVKINGYRIELGEIESIILKYPGINNCVVTANVNENGEKSLGAYFSAKEDVLLSDLQLYLAKKLPRYMVPSGYKQLEKLPLSANGKVDRKLVSKFDLLSVNNEVKYIAPENEIEELIAGIWEEIFPLKKISTIANFIEIGGDSLAALRINTQIQEQLEISLPLNKIFEFPTITTYADYIEKTIIEFL